MRKNVTPQQLAITSTAVITICLLVMLSVAHFLQFLNIKTNALLAIGLLTGLISYGVITFTLKNYIYRKIKLIYKNIHKLKLESKYKVSEIDVNSDIIGEVEKEVSEWTNSQRKEINQLKALEEYRKNFLGDISHELKTPIFNIQGYVFSLLEGGIQDSNVNTSFLRKAAQNLERLHTIVEDLDAISRLESGEWVLELQEFDIKDLAAEVMDELEMKAKEKNINLKFKDGADTPFIVKADRENIRQVLVNLVINSIKYGKKGGGTTKVSFYDMDNFVLVEIADNGIGIAKDDLKRIFDRFYRVEKSRSRTQGGSGLGLSIVKHIIDAHKQTINVRSTLGYGSTFGFTLEKIR